MDHPRLTRPAARACIVLAILMPACEQAETPVAPVMPSHQHELTPADAAFHQRFWRSREVVSWLTRLHARNARFHRFESATRAGYDTQITPCMEDPALGGMGFHYGNGSLIDGEVDEFAPEVLLYEPQRNGKLRLVGVEFIVPFSAWTEQEPPELHGLTFKANETFQVWALHAWVFRYNPTGVFSDWNPRVNCEHEF
jgi:hypothetical protein